MPVYFVRAGDGPVKIGWAVSPKSRLKQLQTAHPESLSILRVVDGDTRAEKWFQRRFAAQRIRGEWYKFSEEMLTVELGQGKIGIIDKFNGYNDSPLSRAIKAAGGLAPFADAIGVTRQAASQWKRRIPAERVLDIERACGGTVTRHELRPDLYPAEGIDERQTAL
jgi:DNA-binding transcriptional regulator YdaS (Cro superfamily)